MEGQPVPFTDVYEINTRQLVTTDLEGRYMVTDLPDGQYALVIYSFDYNVDTVFINIAGKALTKNIRLTDLSTSLTEVEIRARRKELFALQRLGAVEGTAIYEGKKTEVVLISELVGNLAANNPRQIYAQVAGLNIYEGSDAGLQLNIGGRGLNPNRTANFNTRQNSYDISADVLGYPESYYTPPAEALSEIQIVRGAASLQYGTQFGGLVNFKMKQPPAASPLTLSLQQTAGSYGLLTTFADVGGTLGKLSYYVYYNYKSGDGYRSNSGYQSHNTYAYLAYQLSSKTKLSGEMTYLHYLAQQAGGLTDTQFAEDPRQSTRSRNWFMVDWRLYNAKLKHEFTTKTRLSISIFGLNASRDAVGYRGNPLLLNSNPITDLDEQLPDGTYITPRDVIRGTFRNWGAEARLLHQYRLGTALLGAKVYVANNTAAQGAGSLGTDADFSIRNDLFDDYPNQSLFEFPNENVAVFGEHIFRLSDKWSLTPGIRYEYIKTESDGSYQQQNYDQGGNLIFSAQLTDDRMLSRTLALLGLGASYKPNKEVEVYANVSQNYRSVTFSDIRTVNPTFIIDPDITDERGGTADLGIRGKLGNQVSYDVGLYSLLYDNRIGIVLDDRANRVRKNIGTAVIYGLESYVEWNIAKSINAKRTDRTLSVFVNAAITGSEYLDSEDADITGKQVEFVPLANVKTGIKAGYKDFLVSLQYTTLSDQYSDAENSAPASPGDQREGVVGTVPGYQVVDLSGTYVWRQLTISAGMLNIFNTQYYTRRATGYPGPGIIPSDGRSVYLTVGYRLTK